MIQLSVINKDSELECYLCGRRIMFGESHVIVNYTYGIFSYHDICYLMGEANDST